jgi:peptide/nickel transport system permease protein
MSKYIIRRLLLVIPLALGITFINFAMYNAAPGDPILMLIDPEERYTMTEEQIEYFRHKLGLDQPLPIRYIKWLGRILQGDMGYSSSVEPGHAVSELIWRALPQTIELMVIGLLVSTTVGIGLGVLAALRPYTLLDYGSTVFAFTFMAVPSFFFSMLLIYVFAIKLNLFPTSGIITPEAPPSLWNHLRHLALPAMATSLGFGGMLRYSRNAMLEVLGQDYVTTARAKGLPEKVVILRHTFKNALLPVVTLITLGLPGLIGGSVIVESIFAWPGMGLLLINAVNFRDYPVMMGGTLISAFLVLFANLLADILYTLVDPRIRYE